ncbi:MAG: hypothetical protein ACRC4W_03785 [Treponemataceae bacterium]
MKSLFKIIPFSPKNILFLIFIIQTALSFAQETKAEDITIVTIEQAERTHSQKDSATDESIIIFSGGVKLSVQKDTTTINISAQSVQFNRERQTLYAEGNITFEQKRGNDEGEVLTATTLLFNVGTLDGIFDASRIVQKKSNALNLSDGSVMIIFSELSGKEESGTVAFKNADLTFCDVEDPHWKIKASRIWLLPGNEFAFFNALIYVGPVPVAYLPFFYYPKDELIFNPVFGSRTREGWFVQTTTYIVGRKALQQADDDKSLYNFIQPTQLMEQKREGLLLRNLNDPAKNIPKHTVKIIGDYYTGLGALTGVDTNFKFDSGVIKELSFKLFLGFSRNLYENYNYNPNTFAARYIPYNPETGEMEWNTSNLFGLKLPFRYSANFKVNINHSLFSLAVSVPINSDPYFEDDFLDRSEFMDWLSYATNIGSTSGLSDESSNSGFIVSEFSWTVSGSLSPNVSALNPFITSLKITDLESSILFRSKDDTTLPDSRRHIDPLRKFYFPHQITPAKFGLQIGGTLFSTTKNAKEKAAKENEDPPPVLEIPSELAFLNGEEEPSGQTTATPPRATNNTNDKGVYTVDNAELYPTISFSAPSTQTMPNSEYSLTYDIKPSFTSTLLHETSTWKTVNDINWSQFESTYYRVYGTADLNSNLSIRGGFMNISNKVTFDGNYQIHPELSDSYYTTDTSRNQVLESDYNAFKLDLTNTNALMFKPFVYTEAFKDTSVSWNTGVRLIRTKFTGTADNPKWDYQLPAWDERSFSDHNVSVDLVSRQSSSFYQGLTVQSDLPPLVEKYTGRLRFGFPYTELSIDTGVERVSAEDASWKKNPLNQTASFSKQLWNSTLKLSQSFKYELEEDYFDSFSVSAEYAGFSLAYRMLYTYDYTYEAGWVASTDRMFIPYSFSVRYASGNYDFKWGTDKVQFGISLSTEVTADLVRPTNTSFSFSPSISLKIKNALELSFSATSENKVIYRYFQKWGNSSLQIPGETNMFVDLWNSFAFWDENLRRSSGFKIKSFTLKATHDLHDWSFSAEVKMSPRLLYNSDRKPYYDFSPYWSISIIWKPFSSLKTTIVDDYGTVKLNPQE